MRQLLLALARLRGPAHRHGDGTVEKVSLFSDQLQSYFWSYGNNRLRLAQIRFYEVPTNTN